MTCMHDPWTWTMGGGCQRECGVLGEGEKGGNIGTTVIA